MIDLVALYIGRAMLILGGFCFAGIVAYYLTKAARFYFWESYYHVDYIVWKASRAKISQELVERRSRRRQARLMAINQKLAEIGRRNCGTG